MKKRTDKYTDLALEHLTGRMATYYASGRHKFVGDNPNNTNLIDRLSNEEVNKSRRTFVNRKLDKYADYAKIKA